MNKTYSLQGKLKWFDELNETQLKAVRERQVSLVVTAGAGCGKTRTLVARYLSLLGEGVDPRAMAAITFTEKAAREMRSRVRTALTELVRASEEAEERQFWSALEAGMDAARIGTIHSLCAEILRAHPAEALLDPLFEILDEGLAAVLRAHIVEDTLVWLADQEDLSRLFGYFSLRRLQDLLLRLLGRRLDVRTVLQIESDPSELLSGALDIFLQNEEVLALLGEMRHLAADGQLTEDAGEKLQAQINTLLANWPQNLSDPLDTALTLFNLRRGFMDLRAGKKTSQAKGDLRELRDIYDRLLGPWLGGTKSMDAAPERALEELYPQITADLEIVFERLEQIYRRELSRRQTLDFDDLEQKTLELLQKPQVRHRWQAELRFLLVDEFQDTNERQRRIFELLSGSEEKGKLFIVGDERQSIYRFRGADVSVFARVREDICRQGGQALNLDATFRSHTALLDGLGDLLEPVMGLAPDALSLQDPRRLFDVRFYPLDPQRVLPRSNIKTPFIEIILGEGQDSQEGRRIAAHALVLRLQKLYEQGEIQNWEDVALLFRASSGFEVYEEALAEAGVPYVTVAGSGFYERPEVRDLLNMLQALSNPQDDLLLAGFLRSPALGLSDEALYRLRWKEGQKRPLLYGLQNDLDGLNEPDRYRAAFALQILETFIPLANRLPAADLLQQLVNALDYQSVLAAGKERLTRNLEKLLEDARASGLVRLRDFLDYLDSVRIVGVREGEASLESRGALQLLTIHKSKGLEFKIVVLADAARRLNRSADPFYLFNETGLGVSPDNISSSPLVYRIAAQMEAERAEAEEKRLLYVALTRAQEKVILSGHVSDRMGDSYLKRVLEGVLEDGIQGLLAYRNRPETWQRLELNKGREAAILLSRNPPEPHGIAAARMELAPSLAQISPEGEIPLYLPIPAQPLKMEKSEIGKKGQDDFALLSGKLFHRAVQVWLAPEDAVLRKALYSMAHACGLGGSEQLERVLRRAERLYEKFYVSDFHKELEGYQRRHEYPCFVEGEEGQPEQGFIDLLCITPQGWLLVEFKTDHIEDETGLEKMREMYTSQVRGYKETLEKQLGKEKVQACFCWLDYKGEMLVEKAAGV